MKDFIQPNLKNYFLEMKEMLQKKNDLNTLTDLLSNSVYTETKPYLTIRKLVPKDSKFKSIELVYETPESVKKIRWELKTTVSSLRQYFGRPRFHYAPHGGATMIGFFGLENQFSGFETIHPDEVKDKDDNYEVISESSFTEIKNDLHVTFVSFDIEIMKNKTTANRVDGSSQD